MGGVLGGLAIILSIIVIATILLKRNRKKESIHPHPIPYDYAHDDQSPLRNSEQTPPELSASHHLPSSSAAPVVGIIPSSKEREIFQIPIHNTVSSLAPSSRDPILSNSEREHAAEGTIPRVEPVSVPDVRGLQVAVDSLRQVIAEIHAERMEAPPNYHSVS